MQHGFKAQEQSAVTTTIYSTGRKVLEFPVGMKSSSFLKNTSNSIQKQGGFLEQHKILIFTNLYFSGSKYTF